MRPYGRPERLSWSAASVRGKLSAALVEIVLMLIRKPGCGCIGFEPVTTDAAKHSIASIGLR